MRRIAAWVGGTLVGLLALVLLAGWLLLQSSFFSDYRRAYVQAALSEQIGQPLIINDDVRMSPSRYSTVYIGGVEIPSQNIDGVNLAELRAASFSLDLLGLLTGDFDIDELSVSNLHVTLLTLEDRSTSWTKESIWDVEAADAPAPLSDTSGQQNQSADNMPPERLEGLDRENASDTTDAFSAAEVAHTGFIRFFADKTAHIDSITLAVDNRWTGFEFLFSIDRLALEQLQGGAVVSLQCTGTMNRRGFEVDGTFPKGEPFRLSARIGGTVLDVDGVPLPTEEGEGYDATIALAIGSLGDLLEGLGLERSFDGTGSVAAHLSGRPAGLAVSDLNAETAFAEGQTVSMSGSIENALEFVGLDLSVRSRLVPKGRPVAPARTLADLKALEINGRLVSAGDGVEIEKLHLETNAFDGDFRKIGPIAVDRAHRTPEGELSLSGVTFQLGPEQAPIVVATGDIRNIFAFEGVEFQGRLETSADILLATLKADRLDEFGSVGADFEISDKSGYLAITRFEGSSKDSDLWSLDVDLSVADVETLKGLDFKLGLDIADGARFLGALNLTPVDTGRVAFAIETTGDGSRLDVTASAGIKRSLLNANLRSEIIDEKISVRGGFVSSEIQIGDLQNITLAALQLESLLADVVAGTSGTEIQPLVIEPERKVLPLVIEKEDPAAIDWFSKEQFLKRLDLEFDVEVKKIVGQPGVSGVASVLRINSGQLKFGPLEATYGGGFLKASAAMNLLVNQDVIHVSGSTGGWDFGDVLDSIGLGIGAHGTLNGVFDVAGRSSSISTFLSTMDGTATIRMKNGRVDSSLIDLAGLGVLGWLFSKELWQGASEIACINAPIRLRRGSVYSDRVVLETRNVQLVIHGQVNWLKDAIAIRAEPRPIGRPLDQSAFPFEVTGRLTDPEIALLSAISAGRSATQGRNPPPSNRPRVPCIADRDQ